ncbi:MAG: AmmeMemoRadiSam system radical SAM enzyme [Desulfovibrionales bacterium]
MHEAKLWKAMKLNKVQCELCSHFCVIDDGERGKCAVRENRGGVLYTLTYDKVASIAIDPVEKKPLYHFMPGTTTFSFGTPGCNISCSFCQNYSLSQDPHKDGQVRGQKVTPELLVEGALDKNCRSISYTYSEPTIFFELMLETCKRAVEKDLANIIVSNGFMSIKCLDELGPFMHAANIDLKAFTDKFYKEQCGARLKPVLENLKHIRELGWWLEVTTLIIPELNDSPAELEELAGFIAAELGPDTPWHLSRFHPDFKLLDRPRTPIDTIEQAYEIGKAAGLKYVYVGNVPGHKAGGTSCPECGTLCIDRSGFFVSGCKIADGKCECGTALAGVWAGKKEMAAK